MNVPQTLSFTTTYESGDNTLVTVRFDVHPEEVDHGLYGGTPEITSTEPEGYEEEAGLVLSADELLERASSESRAWGEEAGDHAYHRAKEDGDV